MKKESPAKEESTRKSFSKLKRQELNDEEKKILSVLIARAMDMTRRSLGEAAEAIRKGLDAQSALIADMVRKNQDYIRGDNQPGPVTIEQDIVKLLLSDSDKEKMAALERLSKRFPSRREIQIYRESVDRINKGSLYAAVVDATLADGRKIDDLSFPELQKTPDLKKQIKSKYGHAKKGSYEDIKHHVEKRAHKPQIELTKEELENLYTDAYFLEHDLPGQLKRDGLTAGEREAVIKRLAKRKMPQTAAEKQAWKRGMNKLRKYL